MRTRESQDPKNCRLPDEFRDGISHVRSSVLHSSKQKNPLNKVSSENQAAILLGKCPSRNFLSISRYSSSIDVDLRKEDEQFFATLKYMPRGEAIVT